MRTAKEAPTSDVSTTHTLNTHSQAMHDTQVDIDLMSLNRLEKTHFLINEKNGLLERPADKRSFKTEQKIGFILCFALITFEKTEGCWFSRVLKKKRFGKYLSSSSAR